MFRLKPAIKEANRIVWKGIVCLCFSSARIQTRFPKAALTVLPHSPMRGMPDTRYFIKKKTKLENWNLWSERKAQMTQRSDNNVFFRACVSISTILIFLWRISKQFFRRWNGRGVAGSHRREWKTPIIIQLEQFWSLPRGAVQVKSHRRVMQPRLIT